jgi:hypothetical protein
VQFTVAASESSSSSESQIASDVQLAAESFQLLSLKSSDCFSAEFWNVFSYLLKPRRRMPDWYGLTVVTAVTAEIDLRE